MDSLSSKILDKADFIAKAQRFSDELYYNHFDIILAFQVKDNRISTINTFSQVCETVNSVQLMGRVNDSLFMLYLCVPKGKEHCSRTIHQTIKQLFYVIKQESKLAYKIVATSKIGISVMGEDCQTMQNAVTHAFQATMEQQSKVNQRVSFFNSKLQLAIKRQLLLEDVVKTAIEHDEVNVVYQPIINCHSWKIDGYEVLSRFSCDPMLKTNTRELIEVAEDINMISELDLLTYHRSLVELKDVIANDTAFLNLNISTNTHQDFSDLFECINLLNKQNKLDHSRLVLDINPTRDSWQTSIEHVKKLTDKGVLTALGDLSPGFDLGKNLVDGGFSYLRLDERFYSKFHNETEYYQVVKLLVKLCRDLKVKVIIQGVSEIEQARVLLFLGVDYLQGNVFTQPVDAKGIGQLPTKVARVAERIFNENTESADKTTNQLMTSIGSIVNHRIPRLEPGDPISLANEYLKTEFVSVLPVIADKYCVGIVDRARLNLHLSPTMGTDLETEKEARIWHRPANFIMNTEFNSVEATLDVANLLNLISDRGYQLPLVVTKRGQYAGMVTELELISYLLQKNT
jgi:EAL domain-containing protein (putative c-di-GMP-specific phosphodiesterase class I)/predicted transcriptional regulator